MASGQELFFISVAAEMPDMHPQTLHKDERLGLIQSLRQRSAPALSKSS